MCYRTIRTTTGQIILFIKINNYKRFEERRLVSQIIKGCHSIEKGLSLEHPRSGFGYEKIQSTIKLVQFYEQSGYDMQHQSVKMFFDVLKAYLDYHSSIGYDNKKLKEQVENIHGLLQDSNMEPYGGYKQICLENVSQMNTNELERIVYSRHSVRYFSKDQIDISALNKAIEVAIQAPSACNRQPTRVHVVDKIDSDYLVSHMKGIGGFEESADKYLIITSDMSAFTFDELNQWVVSSGIFAGYLTLALHVYGIASCIVQRSIYNTKSNKCIKDHYHIPQEQQIICLICIGAYPNTFNVPISKRYNLNDIMTIYK